MVRDFDPAGYKQQAIAHAAIGKAFDLPVILTTSAETGETMQQLDNINMAR